MTNADIEELFQALGPVSIRRMFGGKGIYHEGHIVAVEIRGDLLLKGDALTGPQLEAAGARRWTYPGKTGKTVNMPYWTVPVEAFDDPDVMAGWVRLAFAAALRAAAAESGR